MQGFHHCGKFFGFAPADMITPVGITLLDNGAGHMVSGSSGQLFQFGKLAGIIRFIAARNGAPDKNYVIHGNPHP
jgi:hypothetical protein